MSDPFKDYASSLESPATVLVPVTPSDTTDLTVVSRAINVSQSGFVRMTTTGNTTATVYIAAGVGFPVRATRIWAAETTATGITAML